MSITGVWLRQLLAPTHKLSSSLAIILKGHSHCSRQRGTSVWENAELVLETVRPLRSPKLSPSTGTRSITTHAMPSHSLQPHPRKRNVPDQITPPNNYYSLQVVVLGATRITIA